MAIISPQRNAIVSLGGCPEAEPLPLGQEVAGSDGQELHPVGISKGSNSQDPVLVFSEKGPAFDGDDEEISDCLYAVLLREPTEREFKEFQAAHGLASTALETVEVVAVQTSDDASDEPVAKPTGQTATYSRIYS